MAAHSFLRAVQLNPMDAFSQSMLSSLHSAQGDAARRRLREYHRSCRPWTAPRLSPSTAGNPLMELRLGARSPDFSIFKEEIRR
jgi:hypothetical protein